MEVRSPWHFYYMAHSSGLARPPRSSRRQEALIKNPTHSPPESQSLLASVATWAFITSLRPHSENDLRP